MPVMDGLQATRLIRSFEETGNWGAAAEAGIEEPSSSSSMSDHNPSESRKRVPIIAVSTGIILFFFSKIHKIILRGD